MKQISGKWKGAIFLLVLSAVLLFCGDRQVSAATKCRVTFADYKGEVTTSTYKNWARTVNAGQTITLPQYSWSGYRSYWEIRTGDKVQKYKPGAKYKVNKSVKFCLQRYKLYDIRFYTDNGSKEYSNLRKQAIKGETISLPSVPQSSNTKGYGWSTSVKDKSYKKAGTKIKITGNMKFYSRTKKITSVNLYKYNGQLWKSVSTDTSKTPVFPSVNLGSVNMCLGWSSNIGDKKPQYFAGDKIPSKTGNYYMVKFGPEDDKAPVSVRLPQKHDKVYFVGDSRTEQMEWGLGRRKPASVEFIAESGQGLDWFQSHYNGGYKLLYRKVRQVYQSSGGQARQAVIINLGVNDLYNAAEYVSYLKRVSKELREKFNCDMYYMSVNPVNSAMVRAYYAESGYGTYRTEAEVKAFNRYIRSALCSGRNQYFKYLDSCTALQKYGWISDRQNRGIYDGVHYSYQTYLRIYDYCIKNLNK